MTDAGAVRDATTFGTLLNGRVRYEQPVRGFRTGIEPVFLAAAVPARPGDRVLEGGTGAGAGLLCLLARVPGVMGVGVERDAGMASIAVRNAGGVPGLSITAGEIERLSDGAPFDHACANPPWHEPAGTPSPDSVRRAAVQADGPGILADWCRALVRHLRPGGSVTLILPARSAGAGTKALHEAGGGSVLVRPLVPREGRPPRIVLLHARAGATGSPAMCPALVLHRPDGRYTAEADSVLRAGAALPWDG